MTPTKNPAKNGRAVSHSFIASSLATTSIGHVSIYNQYKQDNDSSWVESIHLQHKNIETQDGRLWETEFRREELFYYKNFAVWVKNFVPWSLDSWKNEFVFVI